MGETANSLFFLLSRWRTRALLILAARFLDGPEVFRLRRLPAALPAAQHLGPLGLAALLKDFDVQRDGFFDVRQGFLTGVSLTDAAGQAGNFGNHVAVFTGV